MIYAVSKSVFSQFNRMVYGIHKPEITKFVVFLVYT